MLRRTLLRNLGLLGTLQYLPELPAFGLGSKSLLKTVSGTVRSLGKPLAGTAISDGYSITQTDKGGRYSFTPHPQADHVFIILPAGYKIPHNKQVATFYQPLKHDKFLQQANFNLEPIAGGDEEHACIVWGDTQIWDKADAQQLISSAAPDTRKTIEGLGNIPVHGIGCGDLVFDKFELFEDYKEAVAITGIPFFQVIGNHDMDLGARSDELSQQTYKQNFGPTWYSFNRGKVHYVVLDDVFYMGTGKRYMGYISEAQLKWLENDLALVAHGTTVMVSLHIPTNTGLRKRRNAKEEELGGVVINRQALYDMLKPYKVHFLSGHTHFNENWENGDMMEHNHGTVCGAWWTGPVCGDGCPMGYGVYRIKGSEVTWHYQSMGKPASHQLRIYKPDMFKTKPNHVLVNVWNWDPKWKVEWWCNGQPKGIMEQYVGLDPWAEQLYLGNKIPQKHKWVEPVLTEHLFTAALPGDAAEIKVRATDRFGNVFEEMMML